MSRARNLPTADREHRAKRLDFYRRFQNARAFCYLTGLVLALLMRAAGVFNFDTLGGVSLIAAMIATAPLCSWLYRLHDAGRLPWPPHGLWMAADVIGATCGVYLSGDPLSIWFIWYMVTSASVAQVLGGRAVIAAIAANGVAYFTCAWVLAPDRFVELIPQLSWRFVLLFGASGFLLSGLVKLRSRGQRLREFRVERELRLAELETLNADLEARSKALEEANLLVSAANRSKTHFLASMSHELRTPLNAIIGFSEILINKLEGSIDPRLAGFQRTVHESSLHLLGLIDNLLDLSKVEAGKMELYVEPSDVGDLVDRVCATIQGMASRRRISIRIETVGQLTQLVLDAGKLKQILLNLLSNAIKYSPDDAEVVVRLELVGADESELAVPSVLIEVIDQGPGIPLEQQAAIFDEFKQVMASGAEQRPSSTGLGLAVVKSFVDLQGGLVRVRSTPGEGSTFEVRLPADVGAYLEDIKID